MDMKKAAEIREKYKGAPTTEVGQRELIIIAYGGKIRGKDVYTMGEKQLYALSHRVIDEAYSKKNNTGKSESLRKVDTETLLGWLSVRRREEGLSEDEQQYTQSDEDAILAELYRRNVPSSQMKRCAGNADDVAGQEKRKKGKGKKTIDLLVD